MTHQAPAKPTHTGLPDRTTLIAFVLLVTVSSGASVAIRFTYTELVPFWSATLRFICGALFFWIAVWVRKIPLPRGRALVGAALFGVFGMGLSLGFNYWGLVKTPASMYQTIAALAPLLTVFLAFFHRLESFHARGLLGALLTVLGIAVAVGGLAPTDVSIPHILSIVAGAACFAEAGIVAKIFPPSHPIATNAIAMTVGAFILGALSLVNGERPTLPTAAATWVAFGYIVVFVTIVTFLLYVFILGRWTASGTSYSFVLIPLATIVIANWVAQEKITWMFLLGGSIVVLGVWVGALMPVKSK